MPVIYNEYSDPQTLPSYFNYLSELDDWACKPRSQIRSLNDGLLKYAPRSKIEGKTYDTWGKLLVCHDYKGGYTESPSSLAYTFNFWDRCDTFIYFSHHRVTIPPPGWINATHRQGVKCLGVLIFEHQESAEDNLRLLVGKLPKSKTGPLTPLHSNGLPVSPHYARLLADLAYERGFDGYLLNFEYAFEERSEQVRALEAWISILKAELKRRVGDYAQTIWYDSIITTGDLRWQDRLNSRNLSFFLASDSFFTNYTWPSPFPSMSAQYLLGIEHELMQGSTRNLRDIFIGVDVWGRGSHGNGGFGSYKAIEHIDPEFMGLSLAFFGPGWTWESEEGSDGWGWEKWWARERTLWVGPEIEGGTVDVPDAPARLGEPPCTHGRFRPMSDFFPRMPPPNPHQLPFFTSFSPGVGYSWFVEGRKVMHKDSGWVDVDKQTSLGDQLWPRPNVSWEDTVLDEPLPKASTTVDFADAFNGGSSLTIRLVGEGGISDEASFRCFWIPLQSLALTPGGLYEVQFVYKISSNSCDLDLALSVKADTEETYMDIDPVPSDSVDDFSTGWSKVSITCRPSERSGDDVFSSVGVILGAAFDDASLPYTIDIQLGQLSVFPQSSPSGAAPYESRLLWADCVRADGLPHTLLLTWEACVSFTTPATVSATDLAPEVPQPPWILDRTPQWFPRFMYSNVYVQARDSACELRPSEVALFVGTSESGAGVHRFSVDRDALPGELREAHLRFFVQGVTDRGSVLPWESCVFVDFDCDMLEKEYFER